jgi:hypothetical protein
MRVHGPVSKERLIVSIFPLGLSLSLEAEGKMLGLREWAA